MDILCGCEDEVTAVKFGRESDVLHHWLLAGSAKGELCIWQTDVHHQDPGLWSLRQQLSAHTGSINSIAPLDGSRLVVTAGADSTVKLWKLPGSTEGEVRLVHAIVLAPRYIPLSVALSSHIGHNSEETLLIIVGGTTNKLQIYTISTIAGNAGDFTHKFHANVTGHEGWVTSLALISAGSFDCDSKKDIWLASGSQDRSIRLWKLRQQITTESASIKEGTSSVDQSLSAKSYTIQTPSLCLKIAFEALLLGHEDWVYTIAWNCQPSSLPRLLSASADNSLIIWAPDPSSGIWINETRLGDISDQKGATSATGSTGGFWIGLWAPDGTAATSLGKTGSWKLWRHVTDRSYWIQQPGLTGHTKAVVDVSWTDKGDFLLSTSSDQTTRLHAEWRSSGDESWYEFARPQIHGYDLNCVRSLGGSLFVSGADEKLLRVFEQPKNVAHMLHKLCGIEPSGPIAGLPEAANMPVLGLSNKETDESVALTDSTEDKIDLTRETGTQRSEDYVAPPTEDYLARHTLWPELEKLYGHGHEISTLATNRSHGIIATACKASAAEHAVIRLYETKAWHEIRPPLTAHSLTVGKMQFDPESDRLLSAGRDRQWSLFERLDKDGKDEGTGPGSYSLQLIRPRSHSRMVLDVAWSYPWRKDTKQGERKDCMAWLIFATAGRDRTIKIWTVSRTTMVHGPEENSQDSEEKSQYHCLLSIAKPSPVTAIEFFNEGTEIEELEARKGAEARPQNKRYLVAGEENGQISYHILSIADGNTSSLSATSPLGASHPPPPNHTPDPIEADFNPPQITLSESANLDQRFCPSKAVMALSWRPKGGKWSQKAESVKDNKKEVQATRAQLAVASADSSLRILSIDL